MSKYADFHKRLNQACSDNPKIPRLNDGLYPYVGSRMDVTDETVRKWFWGLSLPRPDKIPKLAKIVGCDPAWLSTGVSPELDKIEMSEWRDTATGAAYAVFGMITMSGGTCSFPPADDPLADITSFYAAISRRTIRVHVTTARKDGGTWVIPVPANSAGLTIIGVIPENPFEPAVLNMPLAEVEAHKIKRPGGYDVVVTPHLRDFKTGKYVWKRITAIN